MFHVQTDEEKHEHNLPKKLLKYADHYLKKFIPDKELKDSILTENPVPKNFMKVPSLDVFIRDTMKEERRNHELTLDSILENVQDKTRDVLGPLSRVWAYLQEVTSDHEDEDGSIQVDLDLLLTHIQKTILILTQALNTMTYHRRFIIMAQTEAKSILKEKADILGEKDCLLGKDFRNQVIKIVKPKPRCIMQCDRRTKVLRLYRKLQRHPKCLFKRALHVNKDTEVVMEGAELPTNLFIEKKGDRLNPKEKVSVITSAFLNSFSKRTPIHKKSIPGNKNTSGPSSRKTKILSKVLGKINQRPKHIGHYTRVSDTLKIKPLRKLKSLREIGISKDRKILVNQEISDMLKKGAIRECQPHPNQFVSTLFLVGKTDGGNRPVINFKKN